MELNKKDLKNLIERLIDYSERGFAVLYFNMGGFTELQSMWLDDFWDYFVATDTYRTLRPLIKRRLIQFTNKISRAKFDDAQPFRVLRSEEWQEISKASERIQDLLHAGSYTRNYTYRVFLETLQKWQSFVIRLTSNIPLREYIGGITYRSALYYALQKKEGNLPMLEGKIKELDKVFLSKTFKRDSAIIDIKDYPRDLMWLYHRDYRRKSNNNLG